MGQHLLTIQELTSEEIEKMIHRASYFEQYHPFIRPQFQNRFVANLFLEASTRTRFSFEVAEKRLGTEVLQFQPNISSLTKGESLLDTLKTLESLGAEAAIIRIREEGILQELSRQVSLRIVNAGEGQFSHPTQALLDLFTIKKYFHNLKGLNVAIIGDITHSRVAKSDALLLKKMGANVLLSGPESLMNKSIGDAVLPTEEAIQQADVVIMLRIQFERQESEYLNEKGRYREQYGFTVDRLKHLQPHAIILHPAPVNRGLEMDDEVVDHPQSKIFEQIHNGVWIRMAVIERALGGTGVWETSSNKDASGIGINGFKVIS
ncbi:aspartate carbamoyltransferase catalytic subunit [Tepidibacillus marianensis]|uniref:aspartate carbamoyltransferase catalytic subunit n=1 Tax=Tepidibacillus marianensis TaxID=3131995 RepID=UPI0030CC06FF